MKLQVAALVTPFQRLGDLPLPAWIVSTVMAIPSLVARDAFFGSVLLVLFSSAIDYYLGRKRAKLANEFSSLKAHMGAHGKIAGITLLLLVRGFEYWVGQRVGVNSGGMIATAVAVSLFVTDLESIDFHRTQLGAKPIPVLSSLIKALHDRSDAIISTALGVRTSKERP